MNTRIAETIDARDHFLNKRTVTVTHEGHPPSSGKDKPSDKHVPSELDVTSKRNDHESALPAETKSVEETHKEEEESKAETVEHTVSAVPKPKLLKLVLPRFKGDITTFQPFWDSFRVQ